MSTVGPRWPGDLMRRDSPDGKNIACCICFDFFSKDELEPVEGEPGKVWDVCQGCAANEAAQSKLSKLPHPAPDGPPGDRDDHSAE